jgi:hypothetical protein
MAADMRAGSRSFFGVCLWVMCVLCLFLWVALRGDRVCACAVSARTTAGGTESLLPLVLAFASTHVACGGTGRARSARRSALRPVRGVRWAAARELEQGPEPTRAGGARHAHDGVTHGVL